MTDARHLPEPAPTEYGVRVELRLSQPEQAMSNRAEYLARYFFDEKEVEGTLTVEIRPSEKPRPEVEVSLQSQEELPEWVAQFSRTLGRTIARSHAERGFIRRITRWRNHGGDTGGR